MILDKALQPAPANPHRAGNFLHGVQGGGHYSAFEFTRVGVEAEVNTDHCPDALTSAASACTSK